MSQVFGGCVSLEGETLGSLFVERVVKTRPLAYAVLCRACGMRRNYAHTELKWSDRCRNATCGLLQERREDESRRQAGRVEPERDPYGYDPAKLTVQ
jgi:hypothetical protein